MVIIDHAAQKIPGDKHTSVLLWNTCQRWVIPPLYPLHIRLENHNDPPQRQPQMEQEAIARDEKINKQTIHTHTSI